MQQVVLAVAFIAFLFSTLTGNLLFWVNQEPKFSTRSLAFIMFLLAIMSLNSFLLYSGFYLRFPYFNKYLPPLHFLMPPLLWLYVRSVLTHETKFRKNDWLVFIPALFAVINLVPYYLMPLAQKKQHLVDDYLHTGMVVHHYEGSLPVYAFALLAAAWNTLFIFLNYKLIRSFSKSSSVDSAANRKLTAWLTILNCLVIMITISSLINTVLAPANRINLLVVELILSSSGIGICIQLFVRPQILYGVDYSFYEVDYYQTKLPRSYAAIKKHPEGILHNDHICPESTRLFLVQFNNYGCKQRLESLFVEKKPFVHTAYSLEQLAQDTRIPRHTLSAFINYEYGVNFREFLNRYRVDFFKDNLGNPHWKNLTLEAIASECGFGSRSSFIKNFKLITGQTPGEYLRGYKHLQSSAIAAAL